MGRWLDINEWMDGLVGEGWMDSCKIFVLIRWHIFLLFRSI